MTLKTMPIVLIENKFVSIKDVAKCHSVDCKPYLYGLNDSPISRYGNLCDVLKIKDDFSANDILNVLGVLQEKHNGVALKEQDLGLVRRLLECLHSVLKDTNRDWKYFDEKNEHIFMPDIDKILRSSKELCFDEFNSTDISDEDFFYVHTDIPETHAKLFGVRSIKQQLLSETDAFEDWGQEEPLTRRLKVLLEEGYVDGFSVAKELLQNADDAGASKLYFLYDERTNESKRSSLLCEEMKSAHGPALWVYNDAEFSDEDFVNITKLNGGTKEQDTRKIGKFGLGFCSVYNLTDLPSFVSRHNYVVFDPHMRYIHSIITGKSPGLRIDFSKPKNARVMSRMTNQFEIFDDIFGCNITQQEHPFFKGTLFRLPLRSCPSDISEHVYGRNEMISLFHKIQEMAPLMFIFNQNVKEFKLYHMKKGDGVNYREVFSIQKQSLIISANPSINTNVVEEASRMKEELELEISPLRVLEYVRIDSTTLEDEQIKFSSSENSFNWIVSWATGNSRATLEITEKERGCLPVGATAMPIEHSLEAKNLTLAQIMDKKECKSLETGQYFYFLPLPIVSPYKFHINAQFSVTSDRRHFRTPTQDDIGISTSAFGEWNKCLMSDVVVRSLLLLFGGLGKAAYKLWPTDSKGDLESVFTESFYRHIIEEGGDFKVFESNGTLLAFSEVIFLDPQIRKNSLVGQIVFDFLSGICTETRLVDISESIYNILVKTNKNVVEEKTISYKAFVTKFFLPNIHVLEDSEKRDIIMRYVLENEFDDVIEHCIKATPCIPVKPNGELKLISDIVEPSAGSCVFELFEETDKRFPTNLYAEDKFLLKLKRLGMLHDRLSPNLIIDRAKSVISKRAVCDVCAENRSNLLLKYIENTLRVNSDDVKIVSKELKAIPFVTALPRPSYWAFRWSTDDCEKSRICSEHSDRNSKEIKHCFCKSNEIYNHHSKHIVGCHSKVMQHNYLNDLHKVLGVLRLDEAQGDSGVIILLKTQLEAMQESFQSTKPQFKTEECISDVYKCLNSHLQMLQENQIPEILEMRALPIIFVTDRFITSMQIARRVLADCRPYLYSLKDSAVKTFPVLISFLQIKDCFSPTDLVETLRTFYNDKTSKELTDEELAQCKNLLEVLTHEMKLMNITAKIFVEQEYEVFIPDEDKFLVRSTELCFNDLDAPKSDTMRFVHGDIPKNVCKSVGVKKKKVQIFDENTNDFDEFYQEEPLVTRIKNLINAYPLDSGIFKELLQNADDAGATEIHFILDSDIHPSTNLLSKKMKPLQNKSLCVYNNRPFTEEDLIGIRKLGQGSKDEDPSKTGRYGVGFNSVYNFTDAPSFLTKGSVVPNGETLCFFDPLGQFIPGATRKKPGKQVKNVKLFRDRHSSTLDGYHEDHFTSNEGTMFRFPLRTEPSEISKHPCTFERVETLLGEFKTGLKTALLFLKNIQSITVGEIRKHKYTESYKVFIEMDAISQATRRSFNENYDKLCSSYKQDRNVVMETAPYFALYKADIVVKHESSKKESYTVSQALGFKLKPSDEVSKLITEKNIGMMPVAGVACRVREGNTLFGKETGPKYNVHCFLPLPVDSGLPVYVHGYFALDHENRRSLWHEKDKECFKTTWNTNLIQNVLCPAYVKLFDAVRDEESEGISDFQEQRKVIAVVNYVTDLLPRVKHVKGDYWKLLTKCVFRELTMDHHQFLPCCLSKVMEIRYRYSSTQSLQSCLSWLCLKREEDRFPAYNSNEPIGIKTSHLNEILRDVGMKIVSVDKDVQDSMKEAEVPISDLTPDVVVNFLCSFSLNAPGSCSINTDVNIEHTSLHSAENINTLFGYICKTPQYMMEHLKRLPVILCEDGILRCLEESSIFITSFSNLFRDKRKRFLHHKVYQEHKATLKALMQTNSSKLREFNIEDFRDLAAESTLVSIETSRYVMWDEGNLPTQWLKSVWSFIENRVFRKMNSKPNTSQNESVSDILNIVSEFAIVPITQLDGKKLCSPHLLFTLLDIGSFSYTNKDVLRKLDIPTLHEILAASEYGRVCAKSFLTERMAISKCANSVVKCLHFHQNKLKTTGLSVDDATTILRYLNDNLPINNENKDKLRSLRLFVSYAGDIVALKDYRITCVTPYYMPKCGINDVINGNSVLLLKKDTFLRSLLEELGIEERSILDVYIEYILPMQDRMPREDFYQHVTFLASYMKDYEKQSIVTIVQMLRAAPFIDTEEGCKRVEELYDIKQELFLEMCGKSEILPLILQCVSSRKLMLKLNLKTEVMLSDFERFASEIASASDRSGLSEDLCRKSTLLLSYLCRMSDTFFANNNVDNLLSIPFVLPYKVDSKFTKIAASASGNKLEQIRGMVRQENLMTCWSTSLVFPKVVSKKVSEFLQIRERPLPCQWITHCRTVGTMMKNILVKEPHSINPNFVSDVMETIYRSVSVYENEVTLKTEFLDTPIVYFPEKMIVISAKNVVLQCTEIDEIPPYLMKAPNVFGKHFEAFLALGAYPHPSQQSYSAVLSQLKHDEELLPKEISDAVRAMSKLNYLLLTKSLEDNVFNMKTIHLLCTDNVIRSSICTVVDDNYIYRNRLESTEHHIPFVFIPKADVYSEFQLNKCFEKLPKTIRPHLLSEIVNEEIDTSRCEFVPSDVVTSLQEFLQSSIFKESLLRLARHAHMKKQMETWPNEVRDKILDRLNNLRLRSVKGINTVLQLYCVASGNKQDLQTVVGTERSQLVYMNCKGEKTEYFVETSNLSWSDKLKTQLFEFFKTITDKAIDETFRDVVFSILNHSIRQSDIHEIFQNEDILPYNSDIKFEPSCICPGTFVPKHLHKYLDNDFGVIQDFEYNFIVYLVDDPTLEENDAEDCSPTYMFVQVIRRIPDTEGEPVMMQEYEIYCGENEYVTVKAYLLYKLVRKDTASLPSERSVVKYDKESNNDNDGPSFVQEQSLKEICIEIRQELIEAWRRSKTDRRHIVRRLQLKWHPDKNLDKEHLATKAFQYIEHCIRILEKGKHVPEYEGDDEDFVDGGRASGGSSSWWERSWKRHRESYNDEDWFPRGRRGGGGGGGRGNSGDGTYGDPFAEFFSGADQEPYHFHSEARRWQEQADSDLREAARSLQDLEVANNWICYKAHQAAEKSLKAAWYAKDANKIGNIKNSHDLACIALGLDNELESLARQIASLSGHHTRMRYPDTMHRTIPAHAYTRPNADMMTSLSRSLIAHVQSSYLR